MHKEHNPRCAVGAGAQCLLWPPVPLEWGQPRRMAAARKHKRSALTETRRIESRGAACLGRQLGALWQGQQRVGGST
jgi:hypothetical protein